ncbi:MAG: OmpA family protein [Woeseiaceae bacterium]|nr:OmpA family protein [Woeseiaceae bacterium]
MRTIICAVVVAAFALSAPQAAIAGNSADQGYFSMMGSYVDDDEPRGLEDAINGFAFDLGYGINDNWNLEAGLTLAGPKATLPGVTDEDHFGLEVDVQRVFRRGERFNPYLSAGVGHFRISRATEDKSGVSMSLGAGFFLDISNRVALRAEAKRRRDKALPDTRFDTLVNFGIMVPFGGISPKWVDSDGDGVEDGSDNCPNTRAGAKVDAFGCEIVAAVVPPRDSDGDGVIDDNDECPNTPRGAEVDDKGCELDDDGDGVVNRLDECPGTPAGVQVDIKGCEIKAEIRLEGVNFETNSDRLLPGATAILNDAAATLRKNPSIKVEVAGHTDSDGAAAYNEGLSSRRAQTVRDYLASNGVDASRMTVRGYGESQPIADNATAAGKAQNRRVVLRITDR